MVCRVYCTVEKLTCRVQMKVSLSVVKVSLFLDVVVFLPQQDAGMSAVSYGTQQ